MTRTEYTIITLIGILIGLTVAYAAPAFADDDIVGCWTGSVEWLPDGRPWVDDIDSKTHPDIEWGVANGYALIRFDTDNQTDSTTNVLSHRIPPGATDITVCTTHISGGEVIPTGRGSSYAPLTPSVLAVASSVEPHPQNLDLWLTAQGMLLS